MLTAAEWAAIRAERVEAAHTRLLALPPEFRDWVVRQAHNRGMPTLRRETPLGPGEVVTYDALIAKCEREIKTKPAQPSNGGTT